MKPKPRKGIKITRRNMLPLIGSSIFIPFLGHSKSNDFEKNQIDEDNDEYQTLLKPDGTTVKVKVSAIKKSKIVQKNINNKSFLTWLGKKL